MFSLPVLILIASLVLILYICYEFTYPKQYEQLKDIRGPPLWPVVGNLPPASSTGFTKYVNKWYKPSGSPTRFKLGKMYFLHLFTPQHVEALLKHTVNITKGTSYDFVKLWLGEGLLTSKGTKWHKRRKQLTPTFHYKILSDFAVVMNDHSLKMVKLIRKRIETENRIDICPFITYSTLDTICETSMGKQINSQENMDAPYVRCIVEFSDIVIYRMTHPWTWNNFLFSNFTKMGRRMVKSLEIMHSFSEQVIREREIMRQNAAKRLETVREDEFTGKKRMAFLDLLLEMKENGELTFEEVREEVDTFMFEGHDTTATGIMWACYLFGRNPEFQRQVQEEIDEIMRDAYPTSDQLAEMKLLERCIKECHRMYAPVPGIERQLEVPLKIDENITIPAGVNVGVNIHRLHYDEQQFPNAQVFEPDRFLPENIAKRHPYSFCPFSAGPRNCIGQRFAMLETKIIMFHILRNLTLEAMQQPEEMDETYQFVLRPVHGVWLNVLSRS